MLGEAVGGTAFAAGAGAVAHDTDLSAGRQVDERPAALRPYLPRAQMPKVLRHSALEMTINRSNGYHVMPRQMPLQTAGLRVVVIPLEDTKLPAQGDETRSRGPRLYNRVGKTSCVCTKLGATTVHMRARLARLESLVLGDAVCVLRGEEWLSATIHANSQSDKIAPAIEANQPLRDIRSRKLGFWRMPQSKPSSIGFGSLPRSGDSRSIRADLLNPAPKLSSRGFLDGKRASISGVRVGVGVRRARGHVLLEVDDGDVVGRQQHPRRHHHAAFLLRVADGLRAQVHREREDPAGHSALAPRLQRLVAGSKTAWCGYVCVCSRREARTRQFYLAPLPMTSIRPRGRGRHRIRLMLVIGTGASAQWAAMREPPQKPLPAYTAAWYGNWPRDACTPLMTRGAGYLGAPSATNNTKNL
ncbi:Protein of unknown function [Gryllus bimaculatus]|nr:Protein of unknown function [Gryllus bimaculatus]